ncbi:MAG TPA: glycoside hydrolase family 15 protein [Chitinophagaceae bacterium]
MVQVEACITDYTLIGNCRTAALVSRFGAIDWCCMPEFDSPSVFAAMLDRERGGFFLLQPEESFEGSQQYIQGTNVVETIFRCSSGVVKITDCFVAMEEEEKKAGLFPDHEILRIVESIDGEVRMRCVYQPRSHYGKYPAKLNDYGAMGIHFRHRENIIVLQSTINSLQPDKKKESISTGFPIRKGQQEVFSLSCSTQYPAIIPELKKGAVKRLQNTIAYWRHWISHCRYEGLYKAEVLRSLLALKLLTHAPSGAIIAAPTTSLPEEIGGVRNWDYRYCWLRDASFTVRVLLKLGYHEEADAYLSWILHATRLTQPKLQVLYSVFGETRIPEKNCDWLSGYKNSKPVRIGNGAHGQFQLDIYGEVLNAVYSYSKLVDDIDNNSRRFILGLGKTICRLWKKPDEGIWEIRSRPLQHTHSKVMACMGLENLVRICKKFNWTKAPLELFEKTKDEIYRSIETSGVDRETNAYKKAYDNDELDAALLVLPLVRYCEARSPQMMATVREIERRLLHNNFVYRHLNIDDGLPGQEGAFVVANFWLIENLAKSGRLDEAMTLFQKTMAAVPSHGLLAEEINPATGEWLGNYPQGYSHIGLINAAITLTEEMEKAKRQYGNR